MKLSLTNTYLSMHIIKEKSRSFYSYMALTKAFISFMTWGPIHLVAFYHNILGNIDSVDITQEYLMMLH